MHQSSLVVTINYGILSCDNSLSEIISLKTCIKYHQSQSMHACFACLHNIANRNKSYSSVTLCLLSIKYLPSSAYDAVNIISGKFLH